MRKTIACLGATLLCSLLYSMGAASASADEKPVTAQALQEDLDALVAGIERTHPDIRHSTTEPELTAALASVRSQLTRSMTRVEAWRALASLNPVLADGHLFAALPDWRADTAAHLSAGGTLFPFEVYVDPQGQPFVRAALGGATTELKGARIDRIDGVSAVEVSKTLLARVHGDTPAFRTDLLSRRWWLYYWKMYGAKARHDLVIAGKRMQVAGSSQTPAILADESQFERQFQFELLGPETALLKAGTFSWPQESQFFAFTRDAFEKVKAAGVRTLIIDVRDNGGGSDSMWMQGILPYIATQPYRWGSTYQKRVLEKYRDPSETVGEIVSGSIDRWIPPEPDNPLRFSGKVYVLVGPATYSSAILFANVIQDFRFGTLAGVGGAARTKQTGGVQGIVLPHSKLMLWCPRFVLARPSALAEPKLLTPDVPIVDDPFDSRAALQALMAHVNRQQ